MSDDDDRALSQYRAEVSRYERETQVWDERRRKILRRYKDERSPREDRSPRFNILWSMVQTMRPALYARVPKPDIERRFKDADPIGRVTSDILERAVSYFCESDAFDAAMMQSVMDYLLPGRGTCWVRYVPHLRDVEVSEPEITDAIEEPANDAASAVEEVFDEEVRADFVHAEDFGHNICRGWDEVWLVWRKAYLTRAELVRRFGPEIANTIPLDHKEREGGEPACGDTKATIYEAWDKTRKKAVWFHADVAGALDSRDDPLGLENFFPCPRPLAANLANDSLIPVPDYIEYQDQAMELDSLTSRIGSIQKSLKVAGVYDASAQGCNRLLSEGVENQLLPVEQWAVFGEKGGLKGAMDLLPLDGIAAALASLYDARDKTKADLYEITGIADIIRGQSDPNETMGAQQIKSNFACLRLSDRQREVQRYVRDTVRLMVDVIANHFSIDTIKLISGVRLLSAQEKQELAAGTPPPGLPQDQTALAGEPSWEEVEALIRHQPLRAFRVDIETDSVIKADQEAEKAARVEFLKAAGGFLQQAIGVVESQPVMAPLAAQMLMFGVRAFAIGKELEGTFNATIAKIEQMVAQPTQARPDPALAKVQSDAQLQQMKLAHDRELQQLKIESDTAVDQHRNTLEAARRQAEQESEYRLAQMKMQFEQNAQIQIAHIKAAAEIEAARVSARVSDGASAELREQAAE